MTTLTYRYAAMTDVGLKRSNNQDSGYASPRMLVIADGMGGAAAGDLASSVTLEALREIDRDLDPEIDGDALEALTDAVALANHRVGDLIRDNPSVEGMGTTLDAMIWDGEKLAVAHIGDSRAYRFRDGKLAQISTDHTYVQSLIEEGRLSPAEARVHPNRSLLLRAILGRDELEPDFNWLQPSAGDRFLLCSDGLSDMVDEEIIERILRLENVDVIVTELVREALAAGGLDNVTIVVAEFVAANADLDENLSCADGRPQVVGAAAENPQPRTGMVNSAPSTAVEHRMHSTADTEEDPEVLRYAPRPTPRYRWLRWLLAAIVIFAGTATAAFFAWEWTQKQYFVSESTGVVTIYQGIDASVPGFTLNHVYEVTDIDVATLPSYQRQRVTEGIPARSRGDALRIVDNLSTQSVDPAPPSPKPKSGPSPKASKAPADRDGKP